jgi:hypothetical protein
MILVWKFSQNFDKLLLLISWIISMNGVDGKLVQDRNHSKQRLDWFLKSLVPVIVKDVTTTMPQNKDEAITKAQQFDLIYSQSEYLYMVLQDAPPLSIWSRQVGSIKFSRWVDWVHDPFQPLWSNLYPLLVSNNTQTLMEVPHTMPFLYPTPHL